MADDLLGFPGMSKEQAEKVLEKRKRIRAWKKIPKVVRKAARFDAVGLGTVKDLGIRVPKNGLKIAVIPDGQVKEGVPLNHWKWCGEYLERKRPDVIVNIGDFFDMPSLNSHDSELIRAHAGYTYLKDIDAGKRAMEMLMTPIHKAQGWNPHLIYTLGNHEDRIERTELESPKATGLYSLKHLELKEFGWKVIPFLEPVSIGGIAFCHYFPSGVMGRPISTARELLNKLHMSAVAGHLQGKDIAFSRRADGSEIGAIIAGSFYQHDEDYLSPLTNRHWRGMVILHEVNNGSFDEMFVSIRFLERKMKRRKRASRKSRAS